MDLTIEDLRSELKKRGLDSGGDQEELQARLTEELEKEKNEKKTLETFTEDSTENNPESEDTTDKEDPMQKEEMVTTKEDEKDTGNKVEVDEKTDESEVQSLQTPAEEASTEEVKEEEVKTEEKETEEVKNEDEEEKLTEEKDVKKELSTSPPENAKGNDEPTAAEDSNDTIAETKDSTPDLSGTNAKSEENESFIVLVDDAQNDLDADLLSKEKASNKKSESAGSTTCKSGEGKEANASGAGGDKGKTADAKKTDKKVDEKKDGKSKSSTAVHRVKSSKNASSGNPNSCNLWISGLSSNTKATNLKTVFTKYGKVIGAKIVTNARSPGARCYGFLTMSSSEEAAKCIQHLNQTELHGRMISVERAKTNPGLQSIKKMKPALKSDKSEGKKSIQEEKSPNKKSTAEKKSVEGNSPTKKSVEKKIVAGKSSDKKMDKTESKKDGKSQSEKSDTHLRKSRRSSSSKTPSKFSSRSPRSRHRFREGSSYISDRDYRMTSELRKQRSYLEQVMERQKRQIDHGRMVELELQRRQKKEAIMLERLREELRIEKEKLERKRMKLESAKQSQLWKERQEQEMLNGFERERQPVKRPYERKAAHGYSFWEGPKRPNLGNSGRGGGAASGASASRFSRNFSDETTWFSNHKETYDRRNDSYYNRDNKAMEPVTRFSDSNIGRINHPPQRTSHDRYAPPESSSRLGDHVSSDDRFERRDIGSGGYQKLAVDRGREIDRRNVSAHERLGGRIRNQPAGGTNWKADNWSHSHGGIDNNHWVNNNVNSNYGSSAGSSGGFAGGSGTSGSGHGAQNMEAGSMYYNAGQRSGMMSTGGGGNNMGSRMQESRFDAYKNLEHGSMRRY